MGVCPIPTSESDRKTKMETIVQKYDPVSRRLIDMRLTCPFPTISPISVSGDDIGPWTLSWTERYVNSRNLTLTSTNDSTYIVSDLGPTGCIITKDDTITGSGIITVTLEVLNQYTVASQTVQFQYIEPLATITGFNISIERDKWLIEWDSTHQKSFDVSPDNSIYSSLIIDPTGFTSFKITNTPGTQSGEASFHLNVNNFDDEVTEYPFTINVLPPTDYYIYANYDINNSNNPQTISTDGKPSCDYASNLNIMATNVSMVEIHSEYFDFGDVNFTIDNLYSPADYSYVAVESSLTINFASNAFNPYIRMINAPTIINSFNITLYAPTD